MKVRSQRISLGKGFWRQKSEHNVNVNAGDLEDDEFLCGVKQAMMSQWFRALNSKDFQVYFPLTAGHAKMLSALLKNTFKSCFTPAMFISKWFSVFHVIIRCFKARLLEKPPTKAVNECPSPKKTLLQITAGLFPSISQFTQSESFQWSVYFNYRRLVVITLLTFAETSHTAQEFIDPLPSYTCCKFINQGREAKEILVVWKYLNFTKAMEGVFPVVVDSMWKKLAAWKRFLSLPWIMSKT